MSGLHRSFSVLAQLQARISRADKVASHGLRERAMHATGIRSYPLSCPRHSGAKELACGNGGSRSLSRRNVEEPEGVHGWWPGLEKESHFSIHWMAVLGSMFAAGYVILKTDYGDQQHIFSQAQRLYRTKVDKFFGLEPE